MKKNYYKYLLSCVSGAALLFTQTTLTNAAQTQDVILSAKPLTACYIDTITGLEFGDISTLDGQEKVANGSMSLKCSKAASYLIKANEGENGEKDPDWIRRLKSADGGYFIPYKLYEHHANTTPTDEWGVDTDHFNGVSDGDGTVQTYNFSAKIPFAGLSNLNANAYSQVFQDNVTLTVTIN